MNITQVHINHDFDTVEIFKSDGDNIIISGRKGAAVKFVLEELQNKLAESDYELPFNITGRGYVV